MAEIKRNGPVRQRKKLMIAAAALLLLSLLAFDYRLKVRRYSITSAKVDSTIRVALITDLHSCKYGTDDRLRQG